MAYLLNNWTNFGVLNAFSFSSCKVENKPKTTQDRYGDYMHLISVLTDYKIPIGIVCNLLIKCGGNPKGVTAARKCITL